MDLPTASMLFAAGIAGGSLASMVGGASLVTFPAFLAAGLLPITATASNITAVVPANIIAVFLDRSLLPSIDRNFFEANKPRVLDFLKLLDDELKDRQFAAGDTFSVADITGLIGIDFMKPAKMVVPDEFTNVKRWHAELSARPSAAA